MAHKIVYTDPVGCKNCGGTQFKDIQEAGTNFITIDPVTKKRSYMFIPGLK